MGGTWFVPDTGTCGPRSSATGSTPFLGMPESYGWLTQGVLRQTAMPVPLEELADLERLLHALRTEAARLDLSRPLAGQDVADLDATPADAWLDALGVGPHTRDLALAWFSGTVSAEPGEGSILDVVRWLAAADNSLWRWIAAGVLGHTMTEAPGALIDAIVRESAPELVPRRADRLGRAGGRRRHGADRRREPAGRTAPPSRSSRCRSTAWSTSPSTPRSPRASAPRRASATQGTARRCGRSCARRRPATSASAGPNGAGFDFVGTEEITPEGALLVCFSPDPALANAGHDELERAIRAFLPGAELLDHTAHDWAGDPYARGTWNHFRPGQVMRYESALRASEGRLVFAGSHTALLWPGFIDGAVESGLRAGAEAAVLLSR